MSTPAAAPRQAGMLGRRTPKRAPAIRFADIRRAAPEVSPPAAADYLSELHGGWLMLGNGPDPSVAPGFAGCGDCVAVGWANARRTVTTTLTSTPAYPGWTEVLAVYHTQNPRFDPSGSPDTDGPGSPADAGMDMQTLLEWLEKHPGPDGAKLVGFASVDHTSAEEVSAAIDAGGVLLCGVNVQAAQMTQFNDDRPWNWESGEQPEGGHCTALGGYGKSPAGSDPAMRGNWKFLTWAQETSFTRKFWEHGVDELWFPVWPEQMGTREFQAGVDAAAFAAEFEQITGRKLS